ncbi:MAG: hypothetical protein HY842_13485 [Bacteroidetes bacterium]|nr:hypothetical protein [Bacteroidota bacterium]
MHRPAGQQLAQRDPSQNRMDARRVEGIFIQPGVFQDAQILLAQSLELANRYGFAILEDDYDYDFHYLSSPLLPLAIADSNGRVVYIGSLSKTLAPFLRLGFLVAPQNLLKEIAKMRKFIDIQRDYAMEQTMAELFRLDETKRHMKKALKL